MKKLLLGFCIFSNLVQAAYFPSTSLIQGGLSLSVTNPIPMRISDGTSYLLGQKAMSLSLPVVISSDQTALGIKGATDGTGIGNVGNKLRVSNKPYGHDIAGFAVAGHTPIYLIGYVTSVTTTKTDIWNPSVNSVYVFPTAPMQMQVVSSSASDGPAGPGAISVDLEYLDTSYNTQTENILLNGVTPVNTVATNILRVNGFHVMTAGTTATAAGNISLTNLAATVTYSRIPAGQNYARQLIYTVPLGKTLFITDFSFSSKSTTATSGYTQEATLTSTSSPEFEVTPGIFSYKILSMTSNSSDNQQFTVPIAIPATSDVKANCFSTNAASLASCSVSVKGWVE